MSFDVDAIKDASTGSGDLDDTPMYDVLLTLSRQQATGRLTVDSPTGENHMFFMRGQPVGVHAVAVVTSSSKAQPSS